MITRFNQWWKVWGQLWGFVGHVVILNAYFFILSDEMHTNEWLAVVWLFLFFCTGTSLTITVSLTGC